MNGRNHLEVIDALHECVRTLQQGIVSHCCLINAIVEKQVDVGYLEQLARQCPKRSRETLLRTALKEAIDVLEESRRALKSKWLEVLRKRLTAVLIQTN